MKVTTEKLPNCILSVEIELDDKQLQKGLDRAARRLSQKHTIPGFRKGKAPRFIIENYFGREAVMEEATDDLIQRTFKDVLKQEEIVPVAAPTLEEISSVEPFTFRVLVPTSPIVELPDYRAYRIPLEEEPVTDEVVDRALEMVRDKHVVLKELEEPRPAQDGDMVTVSQTIFVDGEEIQDNDDQTDTEGSPDTDIVLEQKRLITEYYEALLGAQVGQELEIVAQVPDDHENEDMRGKEVTFNVEVLAIQERVVPDWDEVISLENFDGTIDEMREEARAHLEASMRDTAARRLFDAFLDRLYADSTVEFPDALVEKTAEDMLESMGKKVSQLGISLDQFLQSQGKTYEDAVEEYRPQAEERLRQSLILDEVTRLENITITSQDMIERVIELTRAYGSMQQVGEEDFEPIAQAIMANMQDDIIASLLETKVRERFVAIATGEALPPPGEEGDPGFLDDDPALLLPLEPAEMAEPAELAEPAEMAEPAEIPDDGEAESSSSDAVAVGSSTEPSSKET